MRKTIPPFRLVPEPLSDEARAVPPHRAAAAGVGRRHRLGGAPEHLPLEDHPACPDCGEQMTFYGQLDSVSDELCLGEAGLVYVFVCLDCRVTASFIHPG